MQEALCSRATYIIMVTVNLVYLFDNTKCSSSACYHLNKTTIVTPTRHMSLTVLSGPTTNGELVMYDSDIII